MYASGRYVDTIYLAGVATECVLRAFAVADSPEFDGRHDLSRLLKAATLERFVGEKQRETIASHLGTVWARWKNNYRYLGEDRLRTEIRQLHLDRGLKGDALKENARMTLESALAIVNKGTFQWKKK
jgi:hypothetical protein